MYAQTGHWLCRPNESGSSFKHRRNSEHAFCISTELDAALFAEMEMARPVWHRDEIYL